MTHTKPEMAAERRICARILRQVRADPCSHCIHRVEGWAHSACMACRTFPSCMEQATGPSFEPDHSTLQSEEAA